MTRLGDPMLDPGGEMEVSDVRLCCGRDEDRGMRSRSSGLEGRKQYRMQLLGGFSGTGEALWLPMSSLFPLCRFNQRLCVNGVQQV